MVRSRARSGPRSRISAAENGGPKAAVDTRNARVNPRIGIGFHSAPSEVPVTRTPFSLSRSTG